MPGIVVFRRRWSVGSDDLVLPAVFLFLLHTTWWVPRAARPLLTTMFPAPTGVAGDIHPLGDTPPPGRGDPPPGPLQP